MLENLGLPRGQRVLPELPGGAGELGVDDAPAGDDLPDRLRQPRRGIGLEQEPGYGDVERAPYRGRSVVAREDEGLALRQLLAQPVGGGQAVQAGQVDVD